MREEDLRVVASLVDWSNSDKILNKVFYEKYGKILEEKLTNFQECKGQMKECIKNNYGDSMVPRTPKRVKPMATLLEQIQQFKTICFDDDDVENSPSKSFDSLANAQNATPQIKPKEEKVAEVKATEVVLMDVRAEIEKLPPAQHANPYVFNEPNDPISASTSSASGAVKMITRSKFTTKKTAKQNTRAAKSPSSKVLRHSARQQKIKNIEEKANQALKHKEDILKEKAERAKRDREEHRQRVEQNNRLKEAEQREREQQLRAQEKRLQEFRLEQEKLERNAALSKSPFRAGLGVSALPKTTPRHLAIQPSKTTPRQLVVPLKRSKNADNNQIESGNQGASEEDVRIKEEERKHEQLGKERQEQERRDQELLEQELREQELREQRRLEMERREQERLEQERLQQEKQEKERRDKERADRERREKERREQQLEKERLEKERREQQLREQKIMEKEQQERDQKFRAVVTHTYDMTPDKIYLPSSENNYNVDDLSSHDETDNDEKPRKEVPKWAQKNTLVKKVAALHKLLSEERRERHFGRLQQPNLSDFFKNQLKQYPLRNSSAIWTSPMGDPTPGESRFMNFQVGNKRK